MRDAMPSTIYLKDYQPPVYWIDETDLSFELHEDYALVCSTLKMRRNDAAASNASQLTLHGEGFELLEVRIDDAVLSQSQYTASANSLTIENVPVECVLQFKTRLEPQNNTSLEGLYKSRTMFCTQCEAEGFRKISYYLDRPDVMSVFTVSIDADKARYPVLLSNGNQISHTATDDGRHQVSWHDPFPKPAYLFALVAGELSHIEDSFQTMGGRDVTLRIFVEDKDIGKCDHAMASLIRSMKWDEEVFGREYDLDIFNIVAVDDFNMGAMENKSLNIFNTSCVLASPQTTTDAGFQRIEGIVAHEYFHNWSGNRVTCRDWFQLSLKEGFTVFRDAEFSSDMGSRTVKRVEDVSFLRTAQFAEDGGPMAHPIRPDSFIEISNFYTVTVYEKGAEVVRMIHTLLGAENFRKGSDLYFERHDGQAVTCEDFVVAMEDASGIELAQFRNWYSQAGTPLLKVTDDYDAEAQTYTLQVEQSCPPTPGQSEKSPFVIPLAVGLLGDAGNLPLKLRGEPQDFDCEDNTQSVLLINDREQSFTFEGVKEQPIPSLLRGFSAPVRLQYDFSTAQLYALMSRDGDGFVRWDSAQQMAVRAIHVVQEQQMAGLVATVEPLLPEACGNLLIDDSLDPAMVSAMLTLPSENYLAELAATEGGADVHAIHSARELVYHTIASAQLALFESTYARLDDQLEYQPSAHQIAKRSLRNVSLGYLCAANETYLQQAADQFSTATNMTDRFAALRALTYFGDQQTGTDALAEFYTLYKDETLVINQWFQLQAMLPAGDSLARVESLMAHPDFDIKNPNKVSALIGAFAANNPTGFHRIDGAGYRFLSDRVAELNAINPQVASRLLKPLTKWRNYVGREQQMRDELVRLAGMDTLSNDVYEVVSKSLD